MAPIGQAIYLWRVYRSLTQKALAARSGVSRPNLSAIEQGARDLTKQTLRRIASALGVSAGVLADGIQPKPDSIPTSSDRHSMDRIARIAAGQRLRASAAERKLAGALASIMKSKTGQGQAKQVAGRTFRLENETVLRLKAGLGPEVFNHLVRRVEKNLASGKL
jgi:transcriptional regulator with XRE-family HTH domain